MKGDARVATIETPLGAFSVTDNDKYTGALIGVMVAGRCWLIRQSFSRVKFKNDVPLVLPTLFGTPSLDVSANTLAIGYVHNLSKRTALYATAARIKDGENNPAIMGATRPSC